MTSKTFVMKVVVIFIILIKFNLVFSQQSSLIGSDYLPIDTLIHSYEVKNGVRIFYQPEWFADKQLHVSVIDLPREKFFSKLTEVGKCALISPDSSSFVLVLPDVMADLIAKNETNQIVIVGNMQEYGKYKKATISGKITDGKNGDPLPGALIYIPQIKSGTSSDMQGKFSLTLPVGDYDVELSYLGYEQAVRKVRLASNGSANFEIFEKSISLTEVTVTSQRANRNISLTQMSLVKLDAKLIKELPTTLGEVDVIKSITLMPGVQSSGELGTGFFVRGGSADQNLILLEDVPVFNSSHLFGLTSIINPDVISDVTLYKAGIPAKYGERASSVLDVQLGDNSREKSTIKGGIGLINSKITLNLPISRNRVNLMISGRTTYSDWILHKTRDIDLMNSSAGFSDINGMLVCNINSNNIVSFFGYYSKDKINIKNSEGYNYSNTLGSVRWNHIFSSTLFSSVILGFSKYEYHMEEYDSIQRDKSYKMKSNLLYKTLKYNIRWIPSDKHSLDLGINGCVYEIAPGKIDPYDNYSFINPVKLQSEKAVEYALYASDNINFTDHFGAEIGLRYSRYNFLGPADLYVYDPSMARSVESITDTLHYSHNKTITSYSGFEPRISIRYTIDENSSVKLSYNRTNQYINLITNSTVMNPADFWKVSNINIKPLKSDQYALGYFRNFGKNMFETSIEVYYKKLNNIIEYKDGASLVMNPLVDADLVNASGYNYGVELFAKKNSGRVTGWISYSFSTSQRKTNGKTIPEQVNRNNYFPSIYDRPHNLNIIGNYHISRRWRFSMAFTYNTGRPVTLPEYKYSTGGNELIYYSDRNEYRLPDYHRLDISITRDESLRIKKFWKGSWTFSIFNVYGRKNLYSSFYQKEMSGNQLYALYIIGRPLPTLTYNFTF